MELKEITVSDNAVRQARQCGLVGDVESRIRGFIAASAPTAHETGNRAFGQFIMLTRGNLVVSFSMIGPRVIDERPVHMCRICQGHTTLITKGKHGNLSRPCPRAFNPDAPLCDTLGRKSK